MNKVLILEENLDFTRNLLNYIMGENKKLQLINISSRVEEMVEPLKLLGKKDILLLDLDSQGINVYEIIALLVKKGRNMPYVICITNNMKKSEKLKPYAYDIIKTTYSFNQISNTINQITSLTDRQYYERIIKEELNNFEINITTLGYSYIIDGIAMALEDDTLLKDFQNGLYKILAKKYNLPRNYNAKWTVEKCINATVRYTDFEVIKTYFHVEDAEKVTPKLFINIIAENLKHRMMQEIDA